MVWRRRIEIPSGPLEKEFDVVCSKDSRYIAMIRYGWFVDFYDFKTKVHDSLGIVLLNEINEEDMNDWKTYHKKVSDIIEEDTISIIENYSKSKRDER